MELEQQLNKILNDPDSMAQIMRLAQSLGGGMEAGGDTTQSAAAPDTQALFEMVHRVQQAGQVDQRQAALFEALKPFLTPDHCRRLERAMQLSRLSHIAGHALRQIGDK